MCAEECEFQDNNCDADVNQLANILMAEIGCRKGHDAFTAANLYVLLRSLFKENGFWIWLDILNLIQFIVCTVFDTKYI